MTPLRSWLAVPKESPFSLRCLPFGIISSAADPSRRVAVAIGNHAVDLKAFALGGGFQGLPEMHSHTDVFSEDALNRFAALGQDRHRAVRTYLQGVLRADDTAHAALLRDNAPLRASAIVPLASVTMHLPMRIGDYTDFYAGIRHASTVGTILRGADKALQPNYTHLPVAYHGRASSIVVSGTPVRRPRGQILPAGSATPVFAACRRMDIELEMAALVCRDSALGTPIDVNEAASYVFGYVLMNDWSARDIQAWEYVPLGPFTAKNFGTTISPWVVLADALEPFRTAALPNDTPLQPYLNESRTDAIFDIHLRVELKTASGNSMVLSNSNAANLIWSFPQMIAHHTITGCNLQVGDLLGSGTISGPDPGTQGSLLEANMGGKTPIQLPGGETRMFLEDGDTITITGWAGDEEGGLVGFGDCTGQVLPALV
ncbi:hypothetical protein SEUCBS139899_002874 [Sporothrix eucalyptigena]|uniref:Fumarylacetoacetase n=1 Tax=Sporothrix eucalyptigena TaxID=1812306 RepID=A0ABP0BX45_9PEZI